MKATTKTLLVLGACLASAVDAQEEEREGAAAPVVAVSRPVLLEEGAPRSYVGVVRAAESVDVAARITGEIRRRCFEEGARVEKGQPLFELEDTACRANAAAAKAEVVRLETQLAFAEKEAARYRACLDGNGVSEADCELKEQERDVLRAEAEAARARLALAEDDLAHARVLCPATGRIGEARFDAGTTVSPESGPLARVVASDTARVRFAVSERDFFELFEADGPKRTTRISVVRADGRVLDDREAVIDFADNEADAKTGTIAVRASLPNADRALVPGGCVRVVLTERFEEPRLAAPVGALVFEGGEKHVFVVGADGVARLRRVGDGPQLGGLQVLGPDFAREDRIVTGGIHKVRAGAPVAAVER